jgi:hypothetical protein
MYEATFCKRQAVRTQDVDWFHKFLDSTLSLPLSPVTLHSPVALLPFVQTDAGFHTLQLRILINIQAELSKCVPIY